MPARTPEPIPRVVPGAAIRRVAAACLVVGMAATALADAASDATRTRLLRDVCSEAATVRESAVARLEGTDDLTPEEVAAVLRTGPARARPGMLRLAAVLGMRSLVPEIAPLVAGRDVLASEAATRALVALGPDAVAAGRAALEAAGGPGLAPGERDARLRHLDVLDVQRRVEHELLGRWRRKGGSYRGRYVELAAFGWQAQPILLAILLDVPLEDVHVAVPETGDGDMDRALRANALIDIATSRRRGYRTFDALPPTIEQEELFDLAHQALADIGDLDLMKEILEDTQRRLAEADDRAGWRPRKLEDGLAWDIEVVLASRGAKERLLGRYNRYLHDVQRMRRTLLRADPEEHPEQFQFFTTKLSELAGVLHQLDEPARFDEAAECYLEIIRIGKALTGREPALAGYNRACALARRGRSAEALDQLARSMDPEISSGSEDLTREWVTEDGDLAPLRSDPRFAAIVERRFGK